MANLSKEQAITLIKEPKHQQEIIRARQKRLRHKLHTEPDTDCNDIYLGEAHTRFLTWVRGLLGKGDNYDRFRQLYRPPITTNELTEAIFSEFEKVFQAKNSFTKFEFSDDALTNDFTDYLKKIGDNSFWETQGFETFKDSIDNILIVDLPSLEVDEDDVPIQPTDRPEPYYFLLDIDCLIDIDNCKTQGTDQSGKQFYFFKTEYVIFKGEDGAIFVFDDTYFRRFVKNGSDEPVLEMEVAHNLGFTPARSFWTTPLNSRSKIQKRSPITNSISEMDWFLFFSISQKYLELYAPFPIYAIYKSKCNYAETGARKAKCVDGFLEVPGQVLQAGEKKERCPNCGSKIRVGPGNIMYIDVPRDNKEDFDLMVNPMKVIPAERTSLDYVKQAVLDKRNEIFNNCVGRGTDAINDQAVNELQVQAGFESRTSVLLKIKRNFEIIHAFAVDTVARLRYGDSFHSVTINYGDEFFVKDESQEIAEYEIAVKAGLPSFELVARRQEIDEARYRDNPEQLERLKIMRNLEPYPDNNVTQLIEMAPRMPGLIPLKQLVLKLNFNSFIDRFEREQGNLLQFGSAAAFDKKIAQVQAVLDQYAQEAMDAGKVLPGPAPVPAPAAA